MYEIPQGANVIGHLFRERERLAHQATTALAQGIVEPFDMIGLATLFANCPMPFRGQDGGIRFPKVGVADRALPIDGWK